MTRDKFCLRGSTMTKRDHIGIAAPAGFKEVVRAAAAAEQQTLNHFIINAIIEHCPDDIRQQLPPVNFERGRPWPKKGNQ